MATISANIFQHTNAELSGAASAAAAALTALDGPAARQLELGSTGTRADYLLSDLSVNGFSLNAACRFTFSGTTPKTISLANLATGAAFSCGDVATLGKFMQLTFYNDGAADITVAPGASNPASIGLAGTTPTLTIPAGKKVCLQYATAGVTIDSTHKNIDCTPTSSGSLILSVGGSA